MFDFTKDRMQYARTHTNAPQPNGLVILSYSLFFLDAVSVVVFIIPQTYHAAVPYARRFYSNDTYTYFILPTAVRWLELIFSFCNQNVRGLD